jgi:integrase
VPHFPKPYFRQNRGLWYVEIDRKQHNLGSDEKAAFDRYHELMRQKPREADLTLAVGVIDAFLTYAKENAAERTFEWYQRHLQSFASSFPPLLAVSQLKKHHLTACLQKRKTLNSTTQNGLCRAVVRAFRWAETQDIIQRSPFKGVEKPKHRSRTVVIAETEYQFMLGHFSENIGLLLETAWHTAARPQELCALEARHVDLKNARWVFPAEESKGKRFPRVVYLDDRALEITRLLVERHPSGKLFCNSDGEPWNRHSVACVFGRLQVDLGLKKMKELGVTVEKPPRFNQDAYPDAQALAAARAEQQTLLYERRKSLYKLARTHGTKYSLYHFRHTWCQRALKAGVDPLTVAILMGHHDPSTIAKVYQHLALDPEFLRKAITKATASGA